MEEQIRILAAISVAITGAIIGWMNVLKPLLAKRAIIKKQKQEGIQTIIRNDTLYRQNVLDQLAAIQNTQGIIQDDMAGMQRDNIERAYCMFVIEHNYCPSGMKSSIQDTYEKYSSRGHNHIAKTRVEEILALPEFPRSKIGGTL